jgi:hypothetical protein
MLCQEKHSTISNCGLAQYQKLRLRSRQRHDGQIREELGLTHPEILRFSMSAQSPGRSPKTDQTVTNERGTSIAVTLGSLVDTAIRFDRSFDSVKESAAQKAGCSAVERYSQSQDCSRP